MSETLKIALVQSSLTWENPIENRERFNQIIDGVAIDSDLIILPEMFTSGFTMNPEHMDKSEGLITKEWMKVKATEKNAAIIGSVSYFETDNYFNRLFFAKPQADTSYYNKRHTFTLAGENLVYKAGDSRLIETFRGFKICPLICYDLRFPVWARNVEDYDVVIYVANWPKPRIGAWDALLKARAIENMAYSIGVNRVGTDNNGHQYCGHSAVYDSLGSQMAFSDEETVIYATLDKKHIQETRRKLQFLEDRDMFTLKR